VLSFLIAHLQDNFNQTFGETFMSNCQGLENSASPRVVSGTSTSLDFRQIIELLSARRVLKFNGTPAPAVELGVSHFEVHRPDWPVYAFTDDRAVNAAFDGQRLTVPDAQGFVCDFLLAEPAPDLEVVYLANATGDETGYGTLEVTDDDLNKVPFERGPGVVLPYLTEINGKKYVQGNLELAFNDEFWGSDAGLYDSEADVRAYCEAVHNFVRPRLPADALLLPLDEGDPGRFIVQVAVSLSSVVNCDDALRKLAAIFGTTANEAEIADFGDLPDAASQSSGL
jgi:hypothetical protein